MFNWLKTTILMAAIVALFGALGMAIGGKQGMLIALVLGGAMNFFAYWFSDKMVLKMYNAQEVDAASSPYLYNMVRELTQRAGLPMPRVYLIDEAQPNAFATGRNPEHAAVAATRGILQLLSERELRGVMAHELAHVRHRDILISTIAATLAGAISMIANFAFLFGGNRDSNNNGGLGIIGTLAAVIVAPLAAMLVQMAVSRTREYSADKRGAEIAGDPLALASALRKIAAGAERIRNPAAEANPALAHMYIANPLHGERMDNLFSTHPAMENRVGALEAMAQAGGFPVGRPQAGQRAAPRPTVTPNTGPWSGRSGESSGGQPGPWGRDGGSNGPWS